MKENLFLNFNDIALILQRDQRTIWCSYHKAILKEKAAFKLKKEINNIPFDIFSNRAQGPLEAIVCYLKDVSNLSFRQIANLLNRDYNTIWLSYKNGKKHGK